MAIIKSSATSVTRGQHSRRSRNIWCSHYDMVKKCTVEFSRENLEENPLPRGPITITSEETITILTADRWATQSLEYYIARARYSMQSSTRYMSFHWVPKLLGPDQKRLSTTRENVAFRRIPTVSSGDLWEQPPKTVMSAGKVTACSTTLKKESHYHQSQSQLHGAHLQRQEECSSTRTMLQHIHCTSTVIYGCYLEMWIQICWTPT